MIIHDIQTADALRLEEETAWLSCSLKMATRHWPVTSLLPERLARGTRLSARPAETEGGLGVALRPRRRISGVVAVYEL